MIKLMKLMFSGLLAVAVLAGCSTTEFGKPINYAKLERLTIGVSTQETVKQVFGYPQEVLYVDSRTIYKYRYLSKRSNETDRHAIDFVFNHNQRLIDITINDAINTTGLDEMG